MSADDPKPEGEETPETLAAEEATGGAPQDELDAKAPTSDAAADEPSEDDAPAGETAATEADEPVAGNATDEPEAEAKPKPKRKPAAKKATKDEPKAQEPAKPASKPKREKAAASNGQPQVVRAHAKYVRTSARKARLVCDHLRGKSVEEARAILLHTPRHVARDWSKLLESAVANAEHNHELVGDELHILSITADEGPTIKRFQPRAMGRASRIRKRTAHLSISLTSKES